MTNPTPHGQVPEALIDLIDAYAETRHRYGGIYNARTEAARKAVIEALSEVQALSAAPEAIAKLRHLYQNMVNGAVRDTASAKRIAEGLLAPAIEALERATPPAEQQAQPGAVYAGLPERHRVFLCTKCGGRECESGSIHLPHPPCKCGYLGFAENLNFTEDQMRDFADRTHALRMQAAPKAAPGDAIDEAMRERDDAEDFIDALLDEVLGHERPEWSNLYGRADALNDVQERMTALHKPAVDKAWGQFQSAKAAPQQEAQEPVAWLNPWRADQVTTDYDAYGERGIPLYAAPQPAPAPLSEMPYEKRKAIQEGEQISASDAWFHARHNMLDTLDRRNVFRAGFDRGWNAALAAQGGKT